MDLSRTTAKRIATLLLFTFFLLLLLVHPKTVFQAATFLIGVFSPFLTGGVIAFILNVPMSFLERKLFKKIKKTGKRSRLVRPLSLLLTFLLVIFVLLFILLFVSPQLLRTAADLGTTLSLGFNRAMDWAQTQFSNNPHILQWLGSLSFDWDSILNSLFSFLSTGAGNFLFSTISAAKTLISFIATFFIALVFSVDILLQKEKLAVQSRKVLYALLPEKTATRFCEICALSRRIFTSFITGQCLEAVLLGGMFFIALSLFKIPYALLISCLIAVTALIPIVGAFIGCAVGVFLLLFVSPVKALTFLILFLVLQQIEGNLIYPHVVGSSIGLPSIWVLMAVSVGGSLFGIGGILFFIPFTSVLYALFRQYINRKLQEKKLDIQ